MSLGYLDTEVEHFDPNLREFSIRMLVIPAFAGVISRRQFSEEMLTLPVEANRRPVGILSILLFLVMR